MPEQQAAEKQPEVAGPVPAGLGFAAPAIGFGSSGTRSHEQAILNLQQTAGNRAVVGMLAGIQRAPLLPGGGQMNAERRAELIRQAIDVLTVGKALILTVKVEPVAEALENMTAQEGRDVRVRFGEEYKWSLRDLIADRLEVNGVPAKVLGIGPKQRQRLQLLLRGTVSEARPDPMAALQAGEALGSFVGSFVGKSEELGREFGAAAAVATRDRNVQEEKEVGGRRLRAQAIQVKGWMDTGKKDRIFALIRGLATRDRRDDRKALSDAYEAEFGEGLYIALSKRFKDPIDFQRIGALFDEDTTKDDQLATTALVEKVKKAEAEVPKLPGGIKADDVPLLAKGVKERRQRVRDARAGLEAHLDEMGRQPAAPDPTDTKEGGGGGTRTRLDAALGQGAGTAGLKYEIGTRTGVKVDDLIARDRRPLVLAQRLARMHSDGSIKPTDIEDAMRELRAAAEADAARLAREAAASPSPEKPPPSADLVREGYFSQFVAEFQAKAGKPLIHVLSTIGSSEDRNRNLALLVREGQIDEVTELHFAVRSSRKDMDRVRHILGDKTGPEIRTLGAEYEKRYGKSLGTALLGTPDEIRRIRTPSTDDILNGRVPKDLPKARKDLEEKLLLLKGAYVYEPTGSVKAQLDFVAELATTRELAGTGQATGAVPVSDAVFEGLADRAGTEADKEAIRGETRHVLSRILGREITVDANRGLFARARDEFGNIDRKMVRRTRDDALAAVEKIDRALEQDPPDLVTARGQVSTLYIAEIRMQHNLGVYEERTEEAFNAFVDVAVMVASTIATAGAGGVIAAAVRATAATLATKLIAKGPDYLTSPELLADLRGGVFSIAGGKLAEKVVGRFVQGWAKGIIDKADELGAAAGIRAQAAAGGAKAVLYGTENIISGGASGGLESLVQGDVDPLIQQFTPTSQGMALVQTGAHGMIKGGRARYGAWQEKRAAAKARKRPGASPETPPTSPGTPAPVSDSPTPIGSLETSGPLPAVPGPGPVGEGTAPPRPASGGDTLHAVSPTLPGTPATPARGGPRRRVRPMAGDLEVPLTPDEFEVPQATMSAQELGLRPDQNSPRQRRNRQEQLRREGKLAGPDGAVPAPRYEAELLAESTGPTGGRRFAAEFTPIREDWLSLPLEVRSARVEAVVNRLLAEAGMPRVEIIADPNLAAGNAGFIPLEWKIVVSAKDLLDPSPEGFAELANAVAHETRHALHIFRGTRASLHTDPHLAVPVRTDVMMRARAVNQAGGFDPAFRLPDPNVPGDRGSLAYGEAVDVIHEAFGPGTPDRPTATGAGKVAKARSEDLRAALAERDAAMAARPFDPVRAQRAEQQVSIARVAEVQAHNAYVKTAPEADAHRAGPSAGKAVLELVKLQQQLVDAQSFASRAATELDAAILSGDARRIRDAIHRAEHMQDRVKEARASLDALVPGGDAPDLAARLGAEPIIPAPGAATPVGPAAGRPTGAAPAIPTAHLGGAQPPVPDTQLHAIKPGGGGDGGSPRGTSADRGQNELLDWATEQVGPRLEAARTRLGEAEKAHEAARQRLAAAEASGGNVRRLSLEVSLANARVGDAQEQLLQAQNMAVRATRVIEGLSQMGDRAAGRPRSAKEARKELIIERARARKTGDSDPDDVGLIDADEALSPDHPDHVSEASFLFADLPNLEARKNIALGHSGHAVTSGWGGGKEGLAATVASKSRDYGYEEEGHAFDRRGDEGSYYQSHSERMTAATEGGQHFASSKPLCPRCQRWFVARADGEGVTQYVADPTGVHVFTSQGGHWVEPHPSGAKTHEPRPPRRRKRKARRP